MASAAALKKTMDAIKASKVLGLTVGSHKIRPGVEIPKAEAQFTPEVSLAGATSTYIIISLDPDAPFPSFPFLGPILHWLQSGLRSSNSSGILTSTDPAITSYIRPGPPSISASHRYLFLLYEQRADFDVRNFAPPEGQAFPRSKRMRYDLEAFEKEAKLGPIVAANSFRCK